MKIRKPDNYDSFLCLGGSCPDNCCIGDELVIDDKTWNFYQTVEGDLAEHLRSVLKEAVTEDDDDGPVHCLSVEGRCPFLNENNLCNLYLAWGEKGQGHICASHPRSEDQLGDTLEKSLIISCPEATRQVLTRRDVQGFLEEDMPEAPDTDFGRSEAAEDETAMEAERTALLAIIQNRKLPLVRRLQQAFAFCREKSATYNPVGEYLMGSLLSHDVSTDTLETDETFFLERVNFLKDLPWKAASWADVEKDFTIMGKTGSYAALVKTYRSEAFLKENYAARVGKHNGSLDSREAFYPDDTVWEQLIVYYLYRYYAWALEDDDRESKLLMALFSCLIIRDLAIKNAVPKHRVLYLSDMVTAVSTWSKTLEYDDDNLYYLFDNMDALS